MKNFLKLFTIVLVVTFFMLSCNDEPILRKGGTIEVTHKLDDGTPAIFVIIVEGRKNSLDEDFGSGTVIPFGETRTFTYDKDNYYTVLAYPPAEIFSETVYLAFGNVKKVTIK
jgi:hypothetical protein